MRDKVDGIESKAEKVEPEFENRPKRGKIVEKLHVLNVRWPWLKVLLVIVLVGGISFGAMAIVRWNVRVSPESAEEVNEDNKQTADTEMLDQSQNEMTDGKNEAESDTKDDENSADDGELDDQKKPEDGGVKTPDYTVPPNTGRKLIALTFDDGPSSTTTTRLLDILAEKQVKVTFFVLGTMAQRSPEVIKREIAEGHEVESHTLSHQNLVKLAGAAIQGEVSGADAILQGIIGSSSKLVRPPYGAINDTVRANVGKPMILWTVDPEDWKYRNTATVRANVVSRAFDGAIVLMHDIHGTTVEAVAGIIDDLRAAGYEFLTVSEMAKERGVVLQNGYSYGSFRP